MVEWSAFLFYIEVILNSNLGMNTGYPDLRSYDFPQLFWADAMVVP
jgi:hypothetical protein